MPRFRDRLSGVFKGRPSEVPEQSASGTFTSPDASSNPIPTAHAVGNTNTAAPIASSTNTATTTPAKPASKEKTKAATAEDDPSGSQKKKPSFWSKIKGGSGSNTAAGPSKAQAAAAAADEEEQTDFNLQVNKKLWPAFDPGEGVLANGNAAGSLLYDFTSALHGQWARGADFGPGYFGNPVFHSNRAASDDGYALPPRLFDLVRGRTVTAEEVGRVRYATVSHVWGRTTDISGENYGVDWKIPIRSADKLGSILEAARVVVGER
ncbi:hypothetical protein IMZ48_49760, partial [Candidatus Bathyarchaeota archaeon]|nr:hypothetical protein [Candidatus Bathyarchaeota archaeon]